MKNLTLILAVGAILTSTFAFAEAGATATSIKEAVEVDCFLDKNGDGICDTCGNTAEECAIIAGEGGCDTCTTCGEKNSK